MIQINNKTLVFDTADCKFYTFVVDGIKCFLEIIENHDYLGVFVITIFTEKDCFGRWPSVAVEDVSGFDDPKIQRKVVEHMEEIRMNQIEDEEYQNEQLMKE